MSTRSTIYKQGFENGETVHIFEELGHNTPGGPGFYVHIFVPWAFDVVIPVASETIEEIKKSTPVR